VYNFATWSNILNEGTLDHLSEAHREVGVFFAHHRSDHRGASQQSPKAHILEVRTELFFFTILLNV
jgi:hypothetical protein